MQIVLKQITLLALMLALVCLSVPSIAQNLPRGEDVIHAPAVGEELCVHNLFQTNMVIQRDKPIHIWGWADAGEKVTVTFAGNTQSTVAGKDRAWKVTLPELTASSEPRKLTVQGKDKTLTLRNILVGDVWVLGGQSNMEFPVSKVENGALEIASANFPEIRMLSIPQSNGPAQSPGFPRLHQWSDWSSRHFLKGDWEVCTPDTVRELSAIGYVFARRVHKAAQVPIGVVDASRGGTTVETWTPDPVIRKIQARPVKDLMTKWDADVAAWDAKADLAKRLEQHKQYIERMTNQGNEIPDNRKDAPTDLRPGPIGNHNHPSHCYNGMIAPLAGLSVKGAIFHQGYNNCFNGTEGALMYREVFPEMIRAWRAAFNDPEMPFGILSLCTAGNVQTRENFTHSMYDAGAYIRAAQYDTFQELYNAGDKHIGFVSTYDLNRRWYHPQLKFPAGERIARWALATQYGMDRQLKWKPPMIREMTAGEGKITIKFDTNVGAVDDGSAIEGFAIAGRDRKFHPADASYLETGKDSRNRPQYDRTTIILTSPMIDDPAHFRYAWARSPMGNLQLTGNTDVPIGTQRSDDWPMENIPLGVLGDTELTHADRGQRNTILKALKLEDLRRQYREAEAFIREHKQDVIKPESQ